MKTKSKVFKIDDDRFYKNMKWEIGITDTEITLTYEVPDRGGDDYRVGV